MQMLSASKQTKHPHIKQQLSEKYLNWAIVQSIGSIHSRIQDMKVNSHKLR